MLIDFYRFFDDFGPFFGESYCPAGQPRHRAWKKEPLSRFLSKVFDRSGYSACEMCNRILWNDGATISIFVWSCDAWNAARESRAKITWQMSSEHHPKLKKIDVSGWFLGPWGPLGGPWEVLGAIWSQECFQNWKTWFVGPPVGPPGGPQNR